MTHDAWGEEHVLYGLYHSEDRECHEQDDPEVLSRVGCLEHGQQDGRDEAHDLEVGHHVEQTDEETQSDGHREADDEEADTEEHAYTERYERLSAEVGVHAVLYVLDDGCRILALSCGDVLHPALGDSLVVAEDEEHVEQHNEDTQQAQCEAECAGEHAP